MNTLTLSNGNRKLKSTADTRFIIWNLPAKITCPYATEHCKKLCYAVKAEKMYKAVLPARQRNLEESKKESFVADMCKELSKLLSCSSYKNAKRIFFRIHESGDFYNQQYFDKWIQIATHFENVTFLAYTKSLPYVLHTSLAIPSNFIIRFSLWDDTNEQHKAIACATMPTYTADYLTGEQIERLGERFCECRDCGKCGKCYSGDIKDIVCQIH